MMRLRALVFVSVVLLSAGCDQATKQLAIERLAGAPPISLAGDAVRLELVGNPGGFLGLGGQLPAGLRRALFVALVPACVAIAALVALRARGLPALALGGLGLLVGGGIGNWLDRLLREGVVTDFVSLGLGGLRTGIFNVADVAIVAGVALLAIAGRAPEVPSVTER